MTYEFIHFFERIMPFVSFLIMGLVILIILGLLVSVLLLIVKFIKHLLKK